MPPHNLGSGRRVAQLVKELNDAIDDNDVQLEARIYSELESIAAANRKDPGRLRVRERRRILAAINRSLEKIHKYDPSLARSLAEALKTRGFISYSPGSSGPSIKLAGSEPGSDRRTPRRR